MQSRNKIYQNADDFIQTFHRGVYFIDDNLTFCKDLGIGQVIQSCKTASAQQLTIMGTVSHYLMRQPKGSKDQAQVWSHYAFLKIFIEI